MELYKGRTPQRWGAMTVEYFPGTTYFIWVNIIIRNTNVLVSHAAYVFLFVLRGLIPRPLGRLKGIKLRMQFHGRTNDTPLLVAGYRSFEMTMPFKSHSFQLAGVGSSHVSTRWVGAEQSRQGGITG